MTKISKDKQKELIAAVVLTLAVISALYFFLIRGQLDSLHNLGDRKSKKQVELDRIQDTKKNSKQIEAELTVVSNQLHQEEEDMASGDYYSTMISLISSFKQPYKNIDIPQFSPSGNPMEVNLLPKFPYRQFTVSISGTAFYHELGQFIAAFENRFPSSRVVNLELSPASAAGPEESEKLNFKMDIISLVKPSGARPPATR